MKLKVKFNTDLAALFVAFIAVAMAAWDGFESRVHNRKSVVPILNPEVSRAFTDTHSTLTMRVDSVGLGPVKVTDFYVFFNGQPQKMLILPGYATPYPSTTAAMSGGVSDLNEKTGSNWMLQTDDASIEAGQVLATDEKKVLLRFRSDMPDKEFRRLISVVESTTDIFICYCSIYDDQCNIAHIGDHSELSPASCKIDEIN